MAHYLKAAQGDGFAADLVTQGQSYPVDEIKKYADEPLSSDISEMTEDQVPGTEQKQLDRPGFSLPKI